MRVLLKKDFTIELLSVDKVINVNDSMVSRLEVEVEENFLLPGERLWVVFSKTKDNPTDDITKEIQLGTDNKTYSVAIPQGVVMQEGTWYFILSARKYYSEEKYFTRRATAPYEFTIAGGLWIDEATDEVVNNGTAQSLYEMAADKIAREQGNAKNIVALQEKADKTAASITDLQGMDGAISETANTALEKANKAEEDINKAKEDIFQLQIDFGGISALGGALSDLEDKVAYGKASSISISVDPLTYEVIFALQADGGITLSTAKLDLPLESVVVDGKFDESTKNVVLTLQNKSEVSFSVADLVDGLISSSEKGAANGVASLDENGKVPKEQLPDDIGSGGGTNADLSDYVKKTQLATSSTAGLVKVSTSYGMKMSNGFIMVQPASESQVAAKSSKYVPLTPSVVDDIVKVGVTTNTLSLTDEEKASACDWIGAVPKWKPAADGSTTLIGLTAAGTYYVYTITFGIPRNNAIPCYVARGAGNNILGTGTPVNDTDCANKKYVDDLVASLQAQINALK